MSIPKVSVDTTHYSLLNVDKEKHNAKEKVIKVPINEIMYTEEDNGRLYVHTPNLKESYLNVISVADNLDELVKTLLLCEEDTLQALPSNYKFRRYRIMI